MKKNLLDKNLLFNIFSILIVYVVFHSYLIKTIINIPNDMFNNSLSYFLSSMSEFSSLSLFLVFTLFFALNFKKLGWKNFENSHIIKIFILFLSSAIFWEQGFYDYNFYLDSNITLDKIIFFSFFILIFYNPFLFFRRMILKISGKEPDIKY